jgi:CheY-like chemotaxis protein
MDGPETLRRLKSDETTSHIPVVFLTGSVQEVERESFTALGAKGILAKPFDPMTLASNLRDCLGWGS